MTLAAGQVIDKLAANLVAANTAAGAKVYTDRGWPVDESELPTLQVFPGDEAIEPATVHWPFLENHSLMLNIVGKVRATSGIDDVLNAFAAQILSALYGTPDRQTLEPLIGVRLEPPGEGAIERVAQQEGQAALAHVTVRALAHFQTMCNDPETLV